jgi:energy-coupling factor transport system ATP-binding protein
VAILRIENLSFSYDGQTDVLKNIDLTVETGCYLSIIGHNGSGKSTLAKLIVGLLESKRGHVYVFDQELTPKSINQIRPHLGIVFQNPDNQFIGATVADDIAFGLENRRIPHEEMQPLINNSPAKSK